MTDHPTPGSPLSADDVAEFEVIQGDEMVAGCSGPRERALAEAMHYATVYGQDGPVVVNEVIRRQVLPTDRRAEAETLGPSASFWANVQTTPPSAGLDAGLETVAWRWTDGDAKHDTVRLATYDPVRYPHVQNVTELVTRQSAAAALETAAEREGELRQELSEMDALRKFIFSALLNAGVMVAPGEEPDAVCRLSDRATRAEAQVADRDKRIAELKEAMEGIRPLISRADSHDYEMHAEEILAFDQALSAIPTPGRE